MGKTKQNRAVEQQQEQKIAVPMPTTIYKPIPKFKSGCKNC